MSTKRILAFTGIRSDYDLMSGLYKRIVSDPGMELGLIVAGAHLSYAYGYTIKNIEDDKLPILAKIESLIDSNTPSSRIKSAAVLLQCCIHTLETFNPDVILYAGDREDAMVGALIGAYLKIPSVHFFGGDHTMDGNVDNPVRHAISKLSSLHFVIHKSHVKRLLKIGEPIGRVFYIGSPSLDKYFTEPFIDKNKLLRILGQPEWHNYAIVIYHAILGQEDKAGTYFREILSVLKELKIHSFVSYPNVDAGSREIIKVIQSFAKDPLFVFHKNIKRKYFINLMRHASFLIGNSSAGIIEAPIVPLGAVNVGCRQKGRYATGNVIFVEQGHDQIKQGIETVLNDNFKERLKRIKSPYGDGRSVERAHGLLSELDFETYKYKIEDPLGYV